MVGHENLENAYPNAEESTVVLFVIKRMFKASDDVEFYDHFAKSFSYENVV